MRTSEYEYYTSASSWDGGPRVYAEVFHALRHLQPQTSILDAGCGNGHLSGLLAARGFVVHGMDTSQSGIAIAREAHPDATFTCSNLTDDLDHVDEFGAVVCVEVIE